VAADSISRQIASEADGLSACRAARRQADRPPTKHFQQVYELPQPERGDPFAFPASDQPSAEIHLTLAFEMGDAECVLAAGP
jgi:hypothetical protein